MRLFVAVHPPADAMADLAVQVARLRIGLAAAVGTNVRLADPADAHLTVAFLGEVAEDRLPAVREALGRAAGPCRGPEPPRLRLGGGGRFGSGRRTVLWVDVLGEVERLAALAARIRDELDAAGLPYDDRPFRPHLTIARPGDRLDVEEDQATLGGYLGPSWPATEVVLVRSHLGPVGGHPGPVRRYEHLAAWPL
ncbi:RNA 2',3'-cyclic phosphodiesterase [Micromonospora sp. NBRC 101691]|uniref:RNA 2',3'-cyclic phosphodiesterase n=1 Tax=Micromonospora sp. NBRC 101691 TaxID=3032198 RepID=UPI0024A3A344|nr:RNA 2',3'-cyclic phosphodiesterase [Micromonospora sp. NBRC 101691]GLY26300.1 RNA 2',3'-cyclic phosphodiesterase [Micromonospora sp. NBRC 101691]